MTITTHKPLHADNGNNEALDYDLLPEPWREWAKLARNFVYFAHLDTQDREDLTHNIIMRLAEVAEVYRQRGYHFIGELV